MSIRASVMSGRLVVDEKIDLPEGTVLDDGGDSLDERERAALETALRASHAEASSGDLRPVADVLRKLRARR
jgi:hypothetical protein